MSDVFISYAREDRPTAQLVAEAVEQRGWSVWWDRRILAGSAYGREIEDALAAARCVVVLWSAHSVASDWVKNEAAEGSERGVLVPVLIEPVKVPLAFRHLQTADLTSSQALEEVCRAVATKLGTAIEPGRQGEWRAVPAASSRFTRTVRLRHGTVEHEVSYRHRVGPDVVLRDGRRAATSWGVDFNRSFRFPLPSGEACAVFARLAMHPVGWVVTLVGSVVASIVGTLLVIADPLVWAVPVLAGWSAIGVSSSLWVRIAGFGVAVEGRTVHVEGFPF